MLELLRLSRRLGEPSKTVRGPTSRPQEATGSWKDEVRLVGDKGRPGPRDFRLGVAPNQSQTETDIQRARATTRPGPVPTQG